MKDRDAEVQAARLAARMQEARRKSALATMEWALGRAVFALVAQTGQVSLDALIAHFEAIIAEEPAGSMERTQAEAIIVRLRHQAG